MKILVITQKVDIDDAVLGFFHRWLEVLAPKFDKVTVVCLEEGEHDLPQNVEVLSLGKESGASRWKYVGKLYSYTWTRRGDYDSVFVHMNQEYVVLCGLLWRALGKRVVLWRNHPHGDVLTRIAVALSHRVMCTSPLSFTARYEKTLVMPAGIDTGFFRRARGVAAVPDSVLYIGRISEVKRVEVLVDAMGILWEKGIRARASIVGDPPPRERRYYDELRTRSSRLEKEGYVRFFEAVPQSVVPELYSSHAVVVNLTPEGSYDKTVPEAMSCERFVIMSNRSFEKVVPIEFRDNLFFAEGDAEDLARKIRKALLMPDALRDEIGKELRRSVVAKESLEKLSAILEKELR